MFKYYMEAYGSGGHELCNAHLETCDGRHFSLRISWLTCCGVSALSHSGKRSRRTGWGNGVRQDEL